MTPASEPSVKQSRCIQVNIIVSNRQHQAKGMNFYHDVLIPRVNVFFLPRHVVRANWTPMVSEV